MDDVENMNSFETTTSLEDDRRLTSSGPILGTSVHECCMIVLSEEKEGAKVWTEEFFESIRITDPSFVRPDQGELPPIIPLDQ